MALQRSGVPDARPAVKAAGALSSINKPWLNIFEGRVKSTQYTLARRAAVPTPSTGMAFVGPGPRMHCGRRILFYATPPIGVTLLKHNHKCVSPLSKVPSSHPVSLALCNGLAFVHHHALSRALLRGSSEG